jgi:hypothetical protein
VPKRPRRKTTVPREDVQGDAKNGETSQAERRGGTNDEEWGATLTEKNNYNAGGGNVKKDEIHQEGPSHHLDRG